MTADIDALARILDGDPTVNGEATAETRALAALATAMQASARPVRAEFKADLRASLIEAARAQAANPSLLSRMRQRVDDATARWRYSTRVAAATGAAAMALSSGGVATAAQQAMPGDVLYGVRLALEDARLALIRDPAERGAAALRYARHRLEEARQAAAAGDSEAAALALVEADESARQGAELLIEAAQNDVDGALEMLGDFTSSQRSRLQALLPTLTGAAADAARDAMTGLERIGARLEVLTGACSTCPSGDSGDVPPNGDGFDFREIPSADKPFQACPCGPRQRNAAPGDGGKKNEGERDKPQRDGGDRNRDGNDGKKPQPPEDRDPADEPQDEPEEPDRVPDTGNEDVDEAGDAVDEIIDEVIPSPPIDPPGSSNLRHTDLLSD